MYLDVPQNIIRRTPKTRDAHGDEHVRCRSCHSCSCTFEQVYFLTNVANNPNPSPNPSPCTQNGTFWEFSQKKLPVYVEHDLSWCSIILTLTLTLTLTLCVRYVLRRSTKLALVRVRSNKIFPVRVHLYLRPINIRTRTPNFSQSYYSISSFLRIYPSLRIHTFRSEMQFWLLLEQ